MARTAGLTALKVRRLTTPGRHGDGNGLYLAISENGAKSWVFMWKRSDRRQARGLGSADTVSLAEARELASDMRKLVREGRDPPSAKALKAGVPTFGAMADAYIASNEAAWGNAKHAYQVRLQLTRYAASLRPMLVDQISTEAVLKTLQPIWKTKVETAKRTRQRIEAVFDYAKAHGHRSGENPARWKGHLASILPSPERLARVEHLPAMDHRSVPEFMARLRAVEGLAARALEFTILCAARVGEVRGAVWSEIDMGNRLWVIPPERMKAGRAHTVPLSDRCMAILGEMARLRNSAYVFGGFWRDRPLGDVTIRMVLRNLGVADATTHGFRSSFRDWAGDETSAAHDVIEAALAHTIKNKAEAAYRRKDALEKRRALMTAWADFCGPAPDKIISIRQHRA